MKPVYISSYCVAFRDYAMLRKMVNEMRDVPVGVEFGTSWHYPDFRQQLDAQVEVFRGCPITLHAPFVESCCEPGSDEYAKMQEAFRCAFDWYHRFDATSMVMHTHSRRIPAERKDAFRQQAETVIREMAQLARKEGGRLTVENVGFASEGGLLYDQTEFVQLFGRLPADVGALIDIGHAMVNGWDIPGLIEALGSRIGGLHLHTNDGTSDGHKPLFTPGMYYTQDQTEALLRTIGRCCPDADLILEYAPGAHITPESMGEDVRRVQALVLQGQNAQ